MASALQTLSVSGVRLEVELELDSASSALVALAVPGLGCTPYCASLPRGFPEVRNETAISLIVYPSVHSLI